MSKHERRTWVPMLAGIVSLIAVNVSAFEISGTIVDSQTNAIPGIRVHVLEEDLVVMNVLTTTYTDVSGSYSAEISGGYGAEDPDMLIVAEWNFQLQPPATYNGHHIVLVTKAATNECPANPASDPAAVPFTSTFSHIVTNHNAASNLTIDLQMDQFLNSLTSLVLHVNEALDYYSDNKGAVTWSVTADVHVAINYLPEWDFFCENTRVVYMTEETIQGSGAGYISDVFHEIGHWVHFHFNGGTLPPSSFANPHDDDTESDPSFALVEGWPSYTAEITANPLGYDGKYGKPRNPDWSFWRGDEEATNNISGPTGRHTNTWESGENVEGAVAGVWFTIHDYADYDFEDNFKVMVEDNPANIWDFKQGFVQDVGGHGTLGARLIYKFLEFRGIPYARAKFQSPAFSEGAPTDNAPPDVGNVKIIDGYPFVRGTVNAKVESATATDLGVNQVVSVPEMRIKYRPAFDSTNETRLVWTQATDTAFTLINGLNDSIELITTNFPVDGAGEWELLVQSLNADGARDQFLPNWDGDGNPQVDSDEKYFKFFGTWFDADTNAVTIKNGKVIVDNHPPSVQNFFPQ